VRYELRFDLHVSLDGGWVTQQLVLLRWLLYLGKCIEICTSSFLSSVRRATHSTLLHSQTVRVTDRGVGGEWPRGSTLYPAERRRS